MPKAQTPPLSVVMPVHNALPYLDEAIESILGQTFADFEFIILNDGSIDGSAERLSEWAVRDARIRLIPATERLGPALSSDRVARAASAAIVARMDADDISLPHRLSEQLALLRERPDVGVAAGLSDVIDERGETIRRAELWRLGRRSTMVPFAHGAIMYRRQVFDQVGGYRKECAFWEDQDLITRMAAISEVLVIPRTLYQVRVTGTSTRSSSEQRQMEKALDRMYRSLARSAPEDREVDRPPSDDGKIDPRVFVSLGSVQLWANRRPRLFRRLLRHGRLKLNAQLLSALGWTFWASASPRTLRSFLRGLLAARNVAAGVRVKSDTPVAWSPSNRNSRNG